MLVPFGTRVVDKNGKGVGTVSRVVLHSGSRQASGLVVHQGVLDRRQIVVPIAKVASFGDEVRLTLSASGPRRPRSVQYREPAADARRVGDAGRLRPARVLPRRGRRVDGGGAAVRANVGDGVRDAGRRAGQRYAGRAPGARHRGAGRGLRRGGAEGRRGRRRGAGLRPRAASCGSSSGGAPSSAGRRRFPRA